jgi:hypothetical protein
MDQVISEIPMKFLFWQDGCWKDILENFNLLYWKILDKFRVNQTNFNFILFYLKNHKSIYQVGWKIYWQLQFLFWRNIFSIFRGLNFEYKILSFEMDAFHFLYWDEKKNTSRRTSVLKYSAKFSVFQFINILYANRCCKELWTTLDNFLD